MIYFDSVVNAYCKFTKKLCEKLSWDSRKGTVVTYETKTALLYEQSTPVDSLYLVITNDEVAEGVVSGRFVPVI